MPAIAESPTFGHAPTGWRAAFSSLRHQQFRWLYASNGLFFFAMNGQFVVRSYLAFQLTDSALALGIINLAVAIPMLLISPLGGVVSDRVERRRLVVIGQGLVVVNELIILTLLLTNTLEFWHLVAVVSTMGAIFPFIMPARQAMTVEIVGRRELQNAMALMMGAMNASRIIAPALAGFIIYLFDVEWTYAVAVTLYVAALLCMAKLSPSRTPARAEKRTIYADMLEGARYVATSPPVRALMLLSIVPMLLAMPFQALLVVFAEDVWETGSRGLGILQAVAGAGGLAGSIYVAWNGDSRHLLRLMMASLFGFAGFLCLFALSPWFLVALPMLFVADVFVSIFGTSNGAALQMLIPDQVRGRVMSLMMMTFGLTPLGTVPVSAAAEAFGAPAAVAGAAVATTIIALIFLLVSRTLRGIDTTVDAAREGVVVAMRPEPVAQAAGGG